VLAPRSHRLHRCPQRTDQAIEATYESSRQH
jgi:hypothetical protein